MSEKSKEYEELLSKLNNLCLSLTVSQKSCENELNIGLNEMMKSSQSEVNDIKECINQLKTVRNQFEQQMAKLSPILSSVSPLLHKFEGLLKLSKLLSKLSSVKRIHNSLESNVINVRNSKEFESRVMSITYSFNQLVNEYKIFDEIHKNDLMKDYLLQIIMFWKQILFEKFSQKFIQTFESIDWPIISAQIERKSHSNVEPMNAFILYFNALLSIDIHLKGVSKSDIADNRNQLTEAMLLPIDLMLTPFRKRFQYHFMETKSKLNRSEKPEWYLSQVIVWIRQNESFLFDNIDPLLRAYYSSTEFIPSKFQLICGLLQCVFVKLKSDLPSLVFDDKLFTHVVDEVLIFNRELTDIDSKIFHLFPNCNLMNIFSYEPFFTRILTLEKKKSAKFVDFILESKTAWNVICGPEGDDELRICECGDNFVAMLQSVTDRCSFLTDHSLQYEFVRLQLEILDDFRLRLIQLLHNCDQSWPPSHPYFAIINTISYLIVVLDEWKNLSFFVKISDIYATKETIFDEIIGLLEHVLNEFIVQIKQTFMNEFRIKFQTYQSIKWFCLKTSDNCLSLSSSASELLYFISTNLVLLEKSLSNTLFETTLHEMANQMNRILLEELVLKNSFNDLGAKQLQYDVSIGFMSLFRLYIPSPELHFSESEINEALKLLNLERGTSLLVLNALTDQHNNTDSNAVLKDLSISFISPLLALNIIRKRIYLK